MLLWLIGGASGWALTSRANSAVLYRLSGSARWTGASQARATTVAVWRGGKPGLAAPAGLVGQAEARSGPDAAPVADPVLVLAELPAGGHVVDGGHLVQQQRQLGAVDLGLRGRVLADHPPARGDLLLAEGGLVGRRWAGHRSPPHAARRPLRAPGHPLYQPTTIPTTDYEMEH